MLGVVKCEHSETLLALGVTEDGGTDSSASASAIGLYFTFITHMRERH